VEGGSVSPDLIFPYCIGVSQVSGSSGHNVFTFQWICSGGTKESVYWLVGLEEETPANKPEINS
jgi:hypothetical protein